MHRVCHLMPPWRLGERAHSSLKGKRTFYLEGLKLPMARQGIEHGWKLPEPCSVDPQHVPGSERLPMSLADAIHAFEHPPKGSPGAVLGAGLERAHAKGDSAMPSSIVF